MEEAQSVTETMILKEGKHSAGAREFCKLFFFLKIEYDFINSTVTSKELMVWSQLHNSVL